MSENYTIQMKGRWMTQFGCRAVLEVDRALGRTWNREINLNEFGVPFVEMIRGYAPNHMFAAVHLTLHLDGLKLIYGVDYRLLEGGLLYLSKIPNSSVFTLDLHWIEP